MEVWYELEATYVAAFINESDWGYPVAICVHAVCMGLFAGLAIVSHLWSLGCFPGITALSVRKLYLIAWPALLLNLFSGLMMFTAQASLFASNRAFQVKLSVLAIAVIASAFLYSRLPRFDGGVMVPFSIRVMSFLTICLLLSVIVSGRLIAYTGDFA